MEGISTAARLLPKTFLIAACVSSTCTVDMTHVLTVSPSLSVPLSRLSLDNRTFFVLAWLVPGHETEAVVTQRSPGLHFLA